MKKIILTLLVLISPLVSLAAPSSVDRITDHIEPLIKTDYIRGAYFVGTTTATSTFAGGLRTILLNVTSTSASSTFANGINLTAGCFSINGACITGGSGGSSASSTLLADVNTFSTSATTTFLGKIDALRGTFGSLRVGNLTSCDTIDTDAYGNFVCGSDSTGAGGAVTGNGIAGMMSAWSSASNLIATSTIIGERFYATSTTATSTILGSLAIGGSTPDATFSVKGIGGKVAQFFTSAGTKLIDIANDGIVTLLGAWNFGEATSLEIPNSASPTYGAGGILALDTTANNLTLATSTTGHVVVGSATTTLYAFSMASTSPDAISGGIIYLPEHPLGQVITGISCFVDGGTSQVINISNDAGSYDSNTVTCDTTRKQNAITTNSSYSAYGGIRLEMGTKTGSWDYLNIRIMGYRTSN